MAARYSEARYLPARFRRGTGTVSRRHGMVPPIGGTASPGGRGAGLPPMAGTVSAGVRGALCPPARSGRRSMCRRGDRPGGYGAACRQHGMWCRLAWRRRNGAANRRHGSRRHGVPPGDCPAAEAGGCGAHLMPRHIHGHPADPPYRLSYSRAPSRTPSGIGLLALHSQWHSRLAERIFSVLSRQRSPWPPAKPARGGSNDGRNRWQRKDHLRNRNVAK